MFFASRNVREHIAPTVDKALQEILGPIGVDDMWWDVTCIPVGQHANGAFALQGFLTLTAKTMRLDDAPISYTAVCAVDVRSLVHDNYALEQLRLLVEQIKIGRSAELGNNNGNGGLIL